MATMEDFKIFLEKVAWEAGLEKLVPSEDGLLQLRAGDIEMGMQFIPSVNKIFLYTEVGYLPENAPSSLYRTLLCDQAAGYRTGGGSFAIVKSTGNLIYQLVYDIDPAEPAAFAQLLVNVLDFTSEWQNKLSAMLNGDEDDSSPALSAESPFSELFAIRV